MTSSDMHSVPVKGFLKSGPNTYSPVCINGAFECDRVIKSGEVLKRTRKTRSWKPIYLVLRPNVLSIYKDPENTKLRHRISLSDLTAVARQRDPKGHAKHMFGLFTPERNYHIEARSDKDAQDWVEIVRREARIDQDEDEIYMASPPRNGNGQGTGIQLGSQTRSGSAIGQQQMSGAQDNRHIYSDSSDAEMPVRAPRRVGNSPYGARRMHSATRPQRPSRIHEYSSASDFSDFPGSTASLALPTLPDIVVQLTESQQAQPNAREAGKDAIYNPSRPQLPRTASGLSVTGGQPSVDDERVVYHGYLHSLRSRNGIRRWKSYWCVLRSKSLCLYKDESEYAALLVVPFTTIVDAVEIDAQRRNKTHCFQIITEERSYRFCATSENELAKWLGAFKSLLAKRRERVAARLSVAAAIATNVVTSPEATGFVESSARKVSDGQQSLPMR